MTARYPSLPYASPQPSGSIVERAGKILGQEQERTAAGVPASLGWDPAGLQRLPEFEQRVRQLREQLQDIGDELTRVLERLPAMVPAAAASPAVAVLPPLSAPAARVDGTSLPSLRAAEGSPGSIAQTALGLVNDGVSPARVVLRVTSLQNAQGDELPGSLVSFSPNPVNVAALGGAPAGVAPGEGQPVQVSVRIPAGTAPGSYAGLVQAVGLAATRAVLVVDVKPASGGM